MNNKKTYAIFGVGIFGLTIIKTLSEYGFDVVAFDQNEANILKAKPYVKAAHVVDFTDLEALKALGLNCCDVAIVATGSSLETSVITIKNLRDLNIPYVIAKANNLSYSQILLEIGVDKVVNPEMEMGERVAKQLLSKNVVDMIDIDETHSIVEMHPPQSWVGKTLKDLDLRGHYGINVLGVRKSKDGQLNMAIGPHYAIEVTDQLLVIAQTLVFEQHEYLGKL